MRLRCAPPTSCPPESRRSVASPADLTSLTCAFLPRACFPGRRYTTELPDGLQPMVSGEDVPQGLLPVPVVTFDDLRARREDQPWCEVLPDQRGAGQRTRGNEEWAPPRRQIIFTIHPRTMSKRKAIAQQNHRCAGCG